MLRKKFKYWLFNNCPGFKGAFPYFGTKTYFPAASEIFRRACFSGVYEADNLNIIYKFMPKNGVLFDIGANIGLIAIPILWHYPNCRVISFEPSPNSLPYLRRTIAESNFQERWLLREVLLGDKKDETDFLIYQSSQGAFDSTLSTERGGNKVQKIKLLMKTLDQEWEELGYPHVAFIKIDVEGAEVSVIQGAEKCIAANHPYILTEWSQHNLKPVGYASSLLLNIANELEYDIFTVPRLLYVPNLTALDLYMRETESFLLVPKSKQ